MYVIIYLIYKWILEIWMGCGPKRINKGMDRHWRRIDIDDKFHKSLIQ